MGSRERRSGESINKANDDVRAVVDFLRKETGIPMVGAIIFGSMTDPEKQPNEESDLDMCLLTDGDNLGFGAEIFFPEWERRIQELGLKNKVSIGGVYDKKFMDKITKPDTYNYVPFWAWNPNAFEIVGSMVINGKKMEEVELREYLKNLMSSELLNKRRREIVANVEERIAKLVQLQNTVPQIADGEVDGV